MRSRRILLVNVFSINNFDAGTRGGWLVAFVSRGMSQRAVEHAVGRLVTDERFRRLFGRDAAAALRELAEEGLELTAHEEAALVATDHRLWDQVADGMDPRLQKISLRPRPADHSGNPRYDA